MSDVAILASGAVSALGEGAAAAGAGAVGQRARVVIARDEELDRAGLVRPYAARAPVPAGVTDRATWLLERAIDGCARELDRVRPGWRGERVGLMLGTSSGGMRLAERELARIARGEPVLDAEGATYFGPGVKAARRLGRPLEPAMLVLGACASSVLSVGLAARWLERGACDVVLAGGYDDVTVFVATGFERLRATTDAPPPRPFRVGRDGMCLGEGAAIVALARAPSRARAYVTGFGAACDAVHITAPDRQGRGLARAVAAALDEAGRPPVDLVSAHATATPYNDPVEARVLRDALPGQAPVVHPFKAQVGHTLGAAGALELLSSLDAIERGVLPAAAGEGKLDPDARVRLLERAEAGAPRVALKLAAAFGGANAAMVLATAPSAARPRRAAYVGGAVHEASEASPEELAARAGLPVDRLGRADALVRLALGAVARLAAEHGPVAGAGIVVGTALATLETNAVFAERIRATGARTAEPRRFPYTSPNAVAGECAIAFGLTGPGFTVGGGLYAGVEALVAASLLVEAGDADRIVVVAVDDIGPAARALGAGGLRPGAVAALVTAEPAGARVRVRELRVVRGAAAPAGLPVGHAALLPLLADRAPRVIESASPPDGLARVGLEPV